VTVVAVTELEIRWLAPSAVVERVDLDATSWVDVARGLILDADAVHDELLATASWEQGEVFRYEKYVPEPRMMGSLPRDTRHPALVATQTWLTRRYRVQFPGPALVQYRDERDSVGFHRDRELRWLDDTIIGVATFGAHRPWLMRPIGANRYAIDDDLADAIDLSPTSGDVLVMGGRSQADWLHAVPKVRGRVRSRISAQWRWTSRRGYRDTNPGFAAPRHFSR
jgi:alkylated DNA repair dioxygenase AlkB